MRIKKMIAGFLAAVMFQSGAMVVSAEENTSASFVYDDFSVNYEIKNSYGDTDVVDVTLTNTGEETIEDWMLYFDPNGEIQYVTNASEMTADNGSMYFKSKDYNADIAPNSTVTFTYAVNNCTEIPDYYALCQSRIEKTSGYDVSINVNETWGNSFNGSIVINNNTNEPIEAWELTVDTNFSITEITNSWAATVTELDNYQYKLKGTYTSTIDANSSVSLGFIGVKSSEPEISFYSLTEIKADPDKMINQLDGNIKLSASTDELLTSEDNLVYFYAKPDYKNVTSMTLIDSETNTVLATMYDDGDFENHGDDLENDGTFSCKINVNNGCEKVLSFIAEDNNIASNSFDVTVYETISDKEINMMIAVDYAIQDLFDSNNYSNASLNEKINMARLLLDTLSCTGTEDYPISLIDPISINFNPDVNLYTFRYVCGIDGYLKVEINEEGSEKNGTLSDDWVEENEDVAKSNVTPYIGNARIVYDFNVFEGNDSFSLNSYLSFVDKWNKDGLSTSIYYNQNVDELNTISEYKSLKGYDFIVLAAHGGDWGGKIILSTNEKPTNEKLKEYYKDIRGDRIIRNGSHFVVTYKFFEYYYDENDLDGSVVYLHSCDQFGVDGVANYLMADAFLSAGANTVIGFNNSVTPSYDHNIMNSFVEYMLAGKTAGESLELAKSENTGAGNATAMIAGNINKKWINSGIKNGDFELDADVPKYWNYDGDIKILDSLGTFDNKGNQFLFISTGIGYKNDIQNSQVSQVLYIPIGMTKLTLSYNVLSEEPMEWIGDEYDDEFTVNIYSGSDCTNVLRESTNTSEWHRTNIINFYGGDNTMYETKWKTVTIDISRYAGKSIKLEFNMSNIGDNSYDSAVLIDNVKIA